LASYAAALIVAGTVMRRFLGNLPAGEPIPPTTARWLTASIPFLTVSLLGIAATEMNTLVLGAISGPREAGLYQPIAKIAPLMLLGEVAIQMPLAPRIAALWEKGDRQALARLIQRSAIAATLATTIIASVILIASPFIFAAFGTDFQSVRSNLYWIAAAQIVNSAFGASHLLLAMAGDMKRRIKAQLITLLVQAALTAILVPRFGVGGAVAALSLQMVAWASTNWLLARRSTNIDTSIAAIWRQRRST
jgi:O-antigen/teichoic acid export membrane protein